MPGGQKVSGRDGGGLRITVPGIYDVVNVGGSLGRAFQSVCRYDRNNVIGKAVTCSDSEKCRKQIMAP